MYLMSKERLERLDSDLMFSKGSGTDASKGLLTPLPFRTHKWSFYDP